MKLWVIEYTCATCGAEIDSVRVLADPDDDVFGSSLTYDSAYLCSACVMKTLCVSVPGCF